ncbi:MAG: transcription antitermination factor NusB [Gemmatales bacterium]|nr:transcription antitermination factor NusB [Gemmatales bacterium]MDW7993408.1 transcription antitermination factor NusB [Gemmatales bacterium]
MTRRHRAREVALQVLYEADLHRQLDREHVQQFLWRRLRHEDLVRFAERLYQGTLTHRPEIDERLGQISENWRVERMNAVDRNILRLGAYELMFCPETPTKVIIDEAIELAKRYGTTDSSAFVNAILDRLAQECRGLTREPPTQE